MIYILRKNTDILLFVIIIILYKKPRMQLGLICSLFCFKSFKRWF